VSLELCSAALQHFGTASEWDVQRLAQARGGQGHVRHPGWGSWARVASTATSSRHRISSMADPACARASRVGSEEHAHVEGRPTMILDSVETAPAADGRRQLQDFAGCRNVAPMMLDAAGQYTPLCSHCHHTAQALGNEQRSPGLSSGRAWTGGHLPPGASHSQVCEA
jgi:hypothetical protein